MSDQSPELLATVERTRSRRQVLRLAGVAGAAGAAGLVMGSGGTAEAANGDAIVIGSTSNSGTSGTLLSSSGGLEAAFSATSTGSESPGLAGAGNGAGDVKCNGTGRLSQLQALTGTAAPTWTPNNNASALVYHELVRSDTGILWASRGANGDTNNRWKRVNAVRVDTATGSGAVFVPSRLLDTRSSAPIAAGGTLTFAVAGSVGVPADAIAVFGNLTAVSTTAGGYPSSGFLTVYPAGASQPTVSNVNVAATGQHAFPNFFFCALGTSGDLTVFSNIATNILVDIAAYVQ